MSAMASHSDREWITIGEVLTQLNREFPDISISKIRFLEGEGLISPQRAKSGYRRYSDDDVAQLRLVLLAQRDHYLPLKVIAEHLAAGTLRDVVEPRPVVEVQNAPERREPEQPSLPFGAPGPADQRAPTVDPKSFVSRSEAGELSGLSDAQVDDLIEAGVITVDPAGRLTGADLQICRAYAVLVGFGVDHRHMRQAKNTASRESYLIGTVVGHLEGEQRADSVGRMLDALSDAHYWLVVADLNRQTPQSGHRPRQRNR